jgi:hypothetical protein
MLFGIVKLNEHELDKLYLYFCLLKSHWSRAPSRRKHTFVRVLCTPLTFRQRQDFHQTEDKFLTVYDTCAYVALGLVSWGYAAFIDQVEPVDVDCKPESDTNFTEWYLKATNSKNKKYTILSIEPQCNYQWYIDNVTHSSGLAILVAAWNQHSCNDISAP